MTDFREGILSPTIPGVQTAVIDILGSLRRQEVICSAGLDCRSQGEVNREGFYALD